MVTIYELIAEYAPATPRLRQVLQDGPVCKAHDERQKQVPKKISIARAIRAPPPNTPFRRNLDFGVFTSCLSDLAYWVGFRAVMA